MYWACSEVSHSRGVSPHTVVAVVRKMARKRLEPAVRKAACTVSPSASIALKRVSITRLSLTTMPVFAGMTNVKV